MRGYIDSLEFVLDARIYSERHYSKNPQSYDGEYIDLQLEEVNDGLEYVSYARYRGHLSLNMGFARFDVGRDVMHWGPGYYNNLALNQFSLPFNSMSLDLQVGPLTVLTIYGDLRVFKGNSNKGNKAARNLYGHRYELDFGNLVVGMSELQVVHDDNNAWLFVPIIPLFMEKGNYTESSNNGALSFDLNYRLFNKARFYTEFFMDDFQSPIELIKNENIQSKWAWMIGAQVISVKTVEAAEYNLNKKIYSLAPDAVIQDLLAAGLYDNRTDGELQPIGVSSEADGIRIEQAVAVQLVVDLQRAIVQAALLQRIHQRL